MNKIISLLPIFFTLFCSCVESSLPKQRAYLRIEFPEPSYIALKEIKSPVDFYYNLNAADINVINTRQFSINYIKMNLVVDMSLKKISKVEDLENNFRDFSLTLETHSKKSNGMFVREYEDVDNRVYAKIFEMRGNVASPIQFYLTDSTSNFIKGSLNLKFKPKYDSIFPTIQYVKNDILVLVESLNWRPR